jgi:hypothetical protein
MAAAPAFAAPLRAVSVRSREARDPIVARADPDARLRELSRAQAPLRRALLALAGRLVAIRGWERLGFARLRDYAVERLGLSARSLQDFAYVDRALGELPRLERAFVSGDLSWSKLRLLARVATGKDEGRWLERARALSVRALEHAVRRVDLGALESGAAEADPEGEDGPPQECVRIRCTPAVRARWWHVRTLASRAAGESVPVWVAMEHVAAEVASALPLEGGREDGDDEAGEAFAASIAVARRRHRRRAANVCAPHDRAEGLRPLPAFVQSLLEGLESADAFGLDARLRPIVVFEQQLDTEISSLLLVVAEARRFESRVHRDLGGYAREVLGMSPRKARALLRLERAGRRCPELLCAYRAGRLSWVQAHALVPLAWAGPSACAAWIDWATRVTVRRLEDEVDRAQARYELGLARFPDPPSNDSPPSEAGAEGAAAAWQTCAPATESETAHPFFFAPRPAARFFRAVVCSTRRHLERRTGRLPTEGEAFGWMLEHALAAWTAADPDPKRAKRLRREHAVFARDGWRCTAPGCSSYRHLQSHHIRFRSAGGSDAPWNRTTLCAFHHHRGVHAGVVGCTGTAPDRLRFALGLRTGQPPLVTYRSGEVAEGISVEIWE